MGLGSRAGKLHMHSDVRPSVLAEKCSGCMSCRENCGSDAIEMQDGHAVIIQEKCSGCAECIAVCQNDAVQIPWSGSTKEELLMKMACYAKAVNQIAPMKIFINALVKITEECDCWGVDQKAIMEDVGYLISRDIVAIDAASIDLVNKHSNNKFDAINEVNKKFQIGYAEKIGLGKKGYELRDI
jgi:uncharacterized protein